MTGTRYYYTSSAQREFRIFPTNVHYGDEQSVILADRVNSSMFVSFPEVSQTPRSLAMSSALHDKHVWRQQSLPKPYLWQLTSWKAPAVLKRKVWLDYWKTRGQVERYPGEREVTLTFHPCQSSELNVTAWVTSPPTEQKSHLMKQSAHRTMANNKRILFPTTESGMQIVKPR